MRDLSRLRAGRRNADRTGGILLALALCVIPGCSRAEPQTPPAAGPTFTILSTSQDKGITQMEVSYPSDSLTVRGFLYLPKQSGRRPAVLFNHGGVSGVSPDVKRRSLDLAALGYVVFAPAYRGEGGSEGRVEVAGGEVNDVLAAADILSRHPRVKADQMAVTGSSHGALIAVLAAARAPDRFRCVVDACGVMDVVSWYNYLVDRHGIQAVSDSLSLAVYGQGPADRPEAFRRRQATQVAGSITMPLLMQYAVEDTIVPRGQAYLFTTALTQAGRPAPELHFYEHLGHAFWFWNDPKSHTKEELDEAQRSWNDFTDFLKRHLK